SIASNSATVEYDETITSVAALKDKINECGFHCSGQSMPKHVCELRPGMPPATQPPARPMTHDMPHAVAHAAAMDMQAIAGYMRNRFWIAQVFSVSIFAYAPMGMDFVRLKPPFGMDLNLLLFFLASAAIIYPVWPFVVGAVRALRNGVLNMAVLV